VSQIKRLQLQKKIGLLFVVFALLTVLIAFSGWSDYKQATQLAQNQTQNLTLLLEQKIASDFKRIDEVLHAAQKIVLSAKDSCETVERLQSLNKSFEGIEAINYFDANGVLQCSSLGAIEGVSIADRPHFQVLKANEGVKKSFSNVIRARTTNERSIAQLQSITNAEGAFVGAVSALYKLDRFEAIMASVDVGDKGVALLRKSNDSMLIARAPWYDIQDFFKPLAANNPIWQKIQSGILQDTLTYKATTDGVMRLGTYKVLDEYPFYVQVAFAKEEYLAPWKTKIVVLALMGTFLTLFFWVTTKKLARGYNKELDAAQRLSHSIEQLKTVLNNTQDVIYSADVKSGKLFFVSPSVQNVYGYTQKEFENDKDLWFKVVHKQYKQTVLAAQNELFTNGKSEATYKIIKKDGSEVWIANKNRLSYDKEGNPTRIDGIVRDISQAKNLELELLKEKTMLQSVFDVLPVGITVTDEEGNIVDCNKESEKILGITKTQHIQRNYAGHEWEIIRSDYTPMPKSEYASVKALTQKKAFFDEEMGIVRSDGVTWILVSAMPIQAQGYGVVIAYIDITEQKNINDKIEKLNKSLENKVAQQTRELRKQLEELKNKDKMLQQQAKLAAMGEMMSAIAHQWRQPLNALSINIQNLDDDYAEGLIDAEFLDKFIAKQTQMITFMSKTIDDFRNFFQTDKTKTHFTIKSAVLNVYKLLQAQLKSSSIEFEIEGEDFTVEGYQSEMQQVFLNLFSNAKDAIIKNAKSGVVRVSLDSKKKMLTFCDTGGGADEAVLERLFDPYFTTKSPDKGTGIGLHISRTIIVSHMGASMRAYNGKDGLCIEIVFA